MKSRGSKFRIRNYSAIAAFVGATAHAAPTTIDPFERAEEISTHIVESLVVKPTTKTPMPRTARLNLSGLVGQSLDVRGFAKQYGIDLPKSKFEIDDYGNKVALEVAQNPSTGKTAKIAKVIVPDGEPALASKLDLPKLDLPTPMLVIDDKTYAKASFGESSLDLPHDELSLPKLKLSDDSTELAEPQMRSFVRAADKLDYRTSRLQIMDERSSASTVYPTQSMVVTIAGADGSRGLSDARGGVTFRDLPSKSRFIALIDDPRGLVRPGVGFFDSMSTKPAKVRVVRELAFNTYLRLIGVGQLARLGSMCGRANNGRRNGDGVAGLKISIDVKAMGPYYFDDYGFLNTSLTTTGRNGRFCFFNVETGPMSVAFFNGQNHIASTASATLIGRHTEEDFDVGSSASMRVRLAIMSGANQQLSADNAVNTAYEHADAADILPLGDSRPLEFAGVGLFANRSTVYASYGRVYGLASGGDIEQALYAIPAYTTGRQTPVLPLIPRGFVDDMSVLAQIVQDSQLGSVLVEHGETKGQGAETLNIKLVNQYGQEVGESWLYADKPITRALIFNVPVGVYTLIVETKDGHWISTDVIRVYSETVTYAATGAPLQLAPQ